MSDWISDFKKSDAPQFAGKSEEKRRQMAIAAKLGAERGQQNEASLVNYVTKGRIKMADDAGEPTYAARKKAAQMQQQVVDQKYIEKVMNGAKGGVRTNTGVTAEETVRDPVMSFASKAHEEWRSGWRKQNDGNSVPRVKKNSDGSEGDINVPFNKLHPDWQKENLAAGNAAKDAVTKHPNDIEKAAEHVHNKWMERNPKQDYNAAQHVPYSELPEDEKEKDRVHVRTMQNLMSTNEEIQDSGWKKPQTSAKIQNRAKNLARQAMKQAVQKAKDEKGFGPSPADKLSIRKNEEAELGEEQSSSQRDTHFSLMNKHSVAAQFAKGANKDAHRMAALNHQMALRNPENSQAHSSSMTASKKLGVTEEAEQLDEIGDTPAGRKALASYAKKASHDARMKMAAGKDFERHARTSRKPEYKAASKEWEDKYKSDARRREAGVHKAIDRLAKEEVEIKEGITKDTGWKPAPKGPRKDPFGNPVKIQNVPKRLARQGIPKQPVKEESEDRPGIHKVSVTINDKDKDDRDTKTEKMLKVKANNQAAALKIAKTHYGNKGYKVHTASYHGIHEEGKLSSGAKDPCWKGYEMVGTKKKNGREVPNCVPKK